MKEILDGLNVTKQVLDKTEKLLSTLFGPSAKEIGEMIADNIRFSRLKNQMRIFSKVVDLLEANNLNARELNLKTLVPLIEQSSLEGVESLQDKWAILTTNICSSPETGFEPKLVKTLSSLSNLEAQVLDFIFDKFVVERESHYKRYKTRGIFNYESVEDIPTYMITIQFYLIESRFRVDKKFINFCIDNLEALGLIKFEDPEIKLDYTEQPEVINEDNNKINPRPYVDLDIEASYDPSNNFNLTVFGLYFIEQCRLINE